MYKKLLIILGLLIILQLFPLFQSKPVNLFDTTLRFNPSSLSLLKPFFIESASFSSASATLSNSRLSFSALLKGTIPNGGSSVIIDSTSGTAPNISTGALNPKDQVIFAGLGNTAAYTVASISSDTVFNLTSGVSSGIASNTKVYRREFSSINLRFNTNFTIPASGYLKIYIPTTSTYANSNDGYPDNTGFDYQLLNNTNFIQWFVGGETFPTITVSTGPDPSSNASIVITLSGNTSAIASGTGNYVVVGSTPVLINPAATDSHTAGNMDIYIVTVQSLDSSQNELEKSDLKVAPVESLFMSATILESLSFTVSGVNTGTTVCGVNPSIETTALAIPFGTIYSGTTYTAGQHLTVNTNSTTGYNITIEESDQMGKDGISCTGAADETVNCIKDTVCGIGGDACDSDTTSPPLHDWSDPSTYYGLGYSMSYSSWPSDVMFWYNQSYSGDTAVFNARQLPDTSTTSGEAAAQIMHNSGPVSNHDGYVCYRLSIPATQPAGYYYNKVKYTATASF